MGIEWILLSYLAGLVPLVFGLRILVTGEVYLSSLHQEPIRGDKARWLGFFTILVGLGYYAVVFWAWSLVER